MILRTPIKAPRANAICERLLGCVRRECLDHLLIVSEPTSCMFSPNTWLTSTVHALVKASANGFQSPPKAQGRHLLGVGTLSPSLSCAVSIKSIGGGPESRHHEITGSG